MNNDIYDYIAKPEMAWITVNQECNFRCVWCYAKGTKYKPSDNMTLDRAKEITQILLDLNINHVTLTGEDPTFWPFLFEYLEYAKSVGIDVSLITNASRFAEPKFWEEYSKNKCRTICVSIKGITAKQFEKIVLGNKKLLDKTMQGIRKAIQEHENINISTVYSASTTVDDIKQIATIAKNKLNADNFCFSLCNMTRNDGTTDTTYIPSRHKTIADVIELYPILDDLYGNRLSMGMPIPFCFWPQKLIDQFNQLSNACLVQDRSRLVFNTDGDIQLCCNSLLKIPVAKFGQDFVDAKSLMKHLNSEDIKNEYAEILRLPSPACYSCDYAQRCWWLFDHMLSDAKES